MPRYAAAVIGAVVVYGIEQLLTDDFARCAVADFAWTAAAIGAIFGTARAVRASRGDDRMVWLLFLAGSVSWLAGQIVRDATEVGQLPMPSPLVADLGFMTAAPLWTIALVLLLRRHGQRLTLYALVLDIPANLEDTFPAGTAIDALWLVGMGAIGIAGAQWVEEREDGRNTRLSGAAIHLSRMVLPGVVAAACSFLLVYADARTVPAR